MPKKAGDAIGDIDRHARIIGNTLAKIVVYSKTQFPWSDAKRQKIFLKKEANNPINQCIFATKE